MIVAAALDDPASGFCRSRFGLRNQLQPCGGQGRNRTEVGDFIASSVGVHTARANNLTTRRPDVDVGQHAHPIWYRGCCGYSVEKMQATAGGVVHLLYRVS